MAVKRKEGKHYVGVDVGGTKTLALLVKCSGRLGARSRCATPREGSAEDSIRAIVQLVGDVLREEGLEPGDLAAIGLAVPGIVDREAGSVVVTPNMNLSGVEIVPRLQKEFGVPVALGNDVNLGTLGERWLGAAQGAACVVGMFIGTGIGGGVVVDGRLVFGCREAAGEIGHIVMQMDGPLCGCGNRGCLEALASRSAIERDIRAGLDAGRQSVITQLLADDAGVMKSKMLKKALKAGDPLVTEVMRRASEVLGCACLTVRHILDPDVIVLGGGVIEACGKFVLPIVQEVVARDALPGARPGSRVVQSALGDDAVVLGAVVLARQLAGEAPADESFKVAPDYPAVDFAGYGEVSIGGQAYREDVYIRGDGKVKKRDVQTAGSLHSIGPGELEKVCKGNPEVLIIGMGRTGLASLTAEGRQFLEQRGIKTKALANQRAVQAFNRAAGRKAAIFHVKC